MSRRLVDDYYALLGVHPDADGAELRRAWRLLASRYHPDRAGVDATATFQRLSAAYEVLSDPLARAAYDRRRGTPKPPTNPAHRPAREPPPAVMLERLCGSLSTLLACGAARIDEDQEVGVITLLLRASEAARGGMATIAMRVELSCPDCAAADRPAAPCARCGGARTVDELFSAWLAVPPGVTSGELLTPSVELPGMIQPVRFRVRLAATGHGPSQ